MGGTASITDLPADVLGRILDLQPPRLDLLLACKAFNLAASHYCHSWWESVAVGRAPVALDKTALVGFQRQACHLRQLKLLESRRLCTLLVPMLEIAGRRSSTLQELEVVAGTPQQFVAAIQAIGSLVHLRRIMLGLQTTKHSWLPASVLSPLSRLTALQSADLDLHCVHGELSPSILGSMLQLTHLSFCGGSGAHPTLIVGWETSDGGASCNDEDMSDPDMDEDSGADGAATGGKDAAAPAATAGPPLRTLCFSGALLAPANCNVGSLSRLEALHVGVGGLSAPLRAVLSQLERLTCLVLDPPLSPLKVEMDPQAQTDLLVTAFDGCRQVRELHLCGLGGLRGIDFSGLSLPQLTRLVLRDELLSPSGNLVWELPWSLLGLARFLEELDLSGCSLLRLRSNLAELLAELPELARVRLPSPAAAAAGFGVGGGVGGFGPLVPQGLAGRLRRKLPGVTVIE